MVHVDVPKTFTYFSEFIDKNISHYSKYITYSYPKSHSRKIFIGEQ